MVLPGRGGENVGGFVRDRQLGPLANTTSTSKPPNDLPIGVPLSRLSGWF